MTSTGIFTSLSDYFPVKMLEAIDPLFIPIIFFVLAGVVVFYLNRLLSSPKKNLRGRHVVITGGSSGIGKSVAIEVVRLGANVTIIARNEANLAAAKTEIMKNCIKPEQQQVQCLSLDISQGYETIEKAFDTAEENLGPIYMLVNCAGMALCGKLEDTSISDIEQVLNLNFLGTVYPTKIVVPKMKQREGGIIVMVSSQAGFLGIFGFSVYSSTKFALRGFAEALHMECKPYKVSVTLSFPPDTDTPGFANEEKSKPLETKLISNAAGLVPPEEVAKKLVNDALHGNFYSTVGFEGFMLKTLCAGMSPVSHVLELLGQCYLMGLFRIISFGYLLYFYRIIRNCMKTRDTAKKSE